MSVTDDRQNLSYSHFVVDLWFTDLNPTEVGIFRKSRHRAKSRQFTKDTDVIGEVKDNGARTHLITYREGAWKDNQGMAKRLVLKLFTEAMTWRATMDLMVGRSLQLSFGAGGFPVMAFSLNIAGHDQIIHVERSARKWPGFPEKFSFFILKDGQPFLYKLRRDWISIGADYTLYDHNNDRIGHLDGKLVSLGGHWDVDLREDHDDPRLRIVLQLFCAMLRFNRPCQRHVADLVSAVEHRQMRPTLEHHEVDLYLNPRRIR
jgi:hypothetical protein